MLQLLWNHPAFWNGQQQWAGISEKRMMVKPELILKMTYMCLSLFFLPFFKWNKQYYVQSICCNTVYVLDPKIGKQIAKGKNVVKIFSSV